MTTATECPVTHTDVGDGRPTLLLHGGAGPGSVADFGARLAATGHRVITPTHPGFDGTPRPASLASIAGLARRYLDLLDELDLNDVTVVGNSIGGWVAAEMNIHATTRLSRVVLVDAVGLALSRDPIVDFFALTMDEVIERSYHDPSAVAIDLSTQSDADRAASAANRGTLSVYGGASMSDPTLHGRLGGSRVPTLVVWGAADGIVAPAHAHAYAAAIPDARVAIIETAGHLPQIETPQILLGLVDEFVAES